MSIVLITKSKLKIRAYFGIAHIKNFEIYYILQNHLVTLDTSIIFSSYLIPPFTLCCLVNLKIKLIFIG